MNDSLRVLEDLGLTSGEAKTYAALLNLGPSTVGPIVKSSGIAYSNVYDVLDRLMEKGLVSFVKKSKRRHYQAAPPTALEEYLEQKKDAIREQEAQLKEALPLIRALQSEQPSLGVEMFIGLKGIRAAYDIMVPEFKEAGKEWLWVYSHEESPPEADVFYGKLANHIDHLPQRGIADEAFKKSQYVKKATHPARYTSLPLFSHSESYGEYLLMISWQPPIVATLIHSEMLANNFRKYFEGLWKKAKP